MGGGWFGALAFGWYRSLRQSFSSIAGAVPNATGTLVRIYAALRSLAGAVPAQTGTLTRSAFIAARSLAGSLPAQTGTLAAVKFFNRAASGDVPAQSATLTRVYHAVRSLAGAVPSVTGDLFHGSTTARGMQGAVPSATGVLTRALHVTTRALSGLFDLSPRYGAPSFGTLAGGWYSQLASPAGVLTRTLGVNRAVAGALEIASGVLTRVMQVTGPALSGALPAVTGILTRSGSATASLAGSVPAVTGALFVSSLEPLQRVVDGAAEVVQIVADAAVGVLVTSESSSINAASFGGLVVGWYAPHGGTSTGVFGVGSAGMVTATVTVPQTYATATHQQ